MSVQNWKLKKKSVPKTEGGTVGRTQEKGKTVGPNELSNIQ